VVPNKTIYVADGDLPLFRRAQELAGGNLSATITRALRRLVELEEGKLEGFEEITVRVGPGPGRRQRFIGVLLAELGRSTKDRVEEFHVYRSRTGKFVVHVARSAEVLWTAGADGSAQGWRKHFSSDQQWGSTAPIATLEVVDSLEELRARIPAELYSLVASAAENPVIEDLDI
jgi:EXLDI family protein